MEDKLEKAVGVVDTGSLSPGGKLNPSQAKEFIDLTVDFSVLTKMGRTIRPANVAGEFARLVFGEVVTEGAVEGETATRVRKPVHSKIEYATKKLRSALDITTETYEENIEGTSYEDTLMTSIGKRIGTDLELLSILGDTAKYAAEGSTEAEENRRRLLRHNDGWFKQGLTGHTVDGLGGNIDKSFFSRMIRTMPVQFKQNRAALRFFASPSILQDYRDQLAGRLTAYGDQSLQGVDAVRVFGVPIVEIPLMPEDLDSLDGSETWADASFIWLTYPQNFVHVITREIEVYFDFRARKDTTEVTVYTRTDDILENSDAMVTGYDIRVKGAE